MVGIVLRDFGGQVLLAAALSLLNCWDAEMAEGRAIYEGVSLAIRHAFVCFLIESNSLRVINLMLHSSEDIF